MRAPEELALCASDFYAWRRDVGCSLINIIYKVAKAKDAFLVKDVLVLELLYIKRSGRGFNTLFKYFDHLELHGQISLRRVLGNRVVIGTWISTRTVWLQHIM